MIYAVFHRNDDGDAWTFVDTYCGDKPKDAVGALLNAEGQALAVPLSKGVTFKLASVLRVSESTVVDVENVPTPHVEQPALDDPPIVA